MENTQKEIPFRESIRLKSVGFRYRGTDRDVLRGIDLEIKKGTKVGIIGETGSGKSTLLDIIMGLLEPTEGELLIDGKAIGPHNIDAWRANIAHVPQSIYLSDASIAENIAFGVPEGEVDMGRVRNAAKLAALDDFISSLPEGYDTRVGERGIQLSGGQRQRIGIARALYRDATVMVFDEATSALDIKTERKIIETINSLEKEITLLVISHRMSILENFDAIYHVERKKIIKIS